MVGVGERRRFAGFFSFASFLILRLDSALSAFLEVARGTLGTWLAHELRNEEGWRVTRGKNKIKKELEKNKLRKRIRTLSGFWHAPSASKTSLADGDFQKEKFDIKKKSSKTKKTYKKFMFRLYVCC